jgi:hypothetical protein
LYQSAIRHFEGSQHEFFILRILRRSEKSHKSFKQSFATDLSLRSKFFYFKISAAPFEMTLPEFSVFSVQSVAKNISAVLIKLCGSLWQKIFLAKTQNNYTTGWIYF